MNKFGKVLENAVDQGKEVFGELQDKVYMQAKQLEKRARKAIREEKAKASKRLAMNAAR